LTKMTEKKEPEIAEGVDARHKAGHDDQVA
jgi:hypothetical protein